MTLSEYDRNNVDQILHDEKKDWFTARLMRLIAFSDEHHRYLIGQSFPEEVALVQRYKGVAAACDSEIAARLALAEWEKTGELPATSPATTSELRRVVTPYLDQIKRLIGLLTDREREEENW